MILTHPKLHPLTHVLVLASREKSREVTLSATAKATHHGSASCVPNPFPASTWSLWSTLAMPALITPLSCQTKDILYVFQVHDQPDTCSNNCCGTPEIISVIIIQTTILCFWKKHVETPYRCPWLLLKLTHTLLSSCLVGFLVAVRITLCHSLQLHWCWPSLLQSKVLQLKIIVELSVVLPQA